MSLEYEAILETQAKDVKKEKKILYRLERTPRTGVFETWNDCKAQIKDYQGAQYKSFPNL